MLTDNNKAYMTLNIEMTQIMIFKHFSKMIFLKSRFFMILTLLGFLKMLLSVKNRKKKHIKYYFLWIFFSLFTLIITI